MSKKKRKQKKIRWKGSAPAHPRRYVIKVTADAPMYLINMVERYLDARATEEGLVALNLVRITIDATYRKKRGKKTLVA